MGDISVIARRLDGGRYVQYGWSGNGGYLKNVGLRLLAWYNDPEKVEYLFGLGQMRHIGKPGSENGGESWWLTHDRAGEPHWVDKSERRIFSKIVFIDYGYFYDLDQTWYYVIPGPFRIKVPLMYMANHVDDRDYEFDERKRIDKLLVKHILEDYYESDAELQAVVKENYPKGIDEIRKDVLENDENERPCHRLWSRYKHIFDYFDDWVVVKTDESKESLKGFLLHKKQPEGERIETIDWK